MILTTTVILAVCNFALNAVCKVVSTRSTYKYNKARRQLCELRLNRYKSASNKLVE
jgi:hypothetical protein